MTEILKTIGHILFEALERLLGFIMIFIVGIYIFSGFGFLIFMRAIIEIVNPNGNHVLGYIGVIFIPISWIIMFSLYVWDRTQERLKTTR